MKNKRKKNQLDLMREIRKEMPPPQRKINPKKGGEYKRKNNWKEWLENPDQKF